MLKFFRSRSKEFILMVVCLIVIVPSTAYALTSSDFYNATVKWSVSNCQNASTTNSINNTVCFLLERNQEVALSLKSLQNNLGLLQDSVESLQNENSAQQQSIENLENAPSDNRDIVVRDADGNKLGVLIHNGRLSAADHTTYVFDTNINKIVNVWINDDSQAGLVGSGFQASFTTSNCTGTPYAEVSSGSDTTFYFNNDRLLRGADNKLYSYIDNATPTLLVRGSIKVGPSTCVTSEDQLHFVALQEHTLTYPVQVSLPLEYSYE